MPFSNLTRWGALAGGVGAIVAGVAYATMLIEPLLWAAGGPSDGAVSYPEQRIIVTQLGSLIGIAGLYALHREPYSPLATAVYLVASFGTALILVSAAAWLLAGPPDSPKVLYLVGIGALTATVGLVLIGGVTVETRVLPRWVGIVMIVGIPAGLVLFLVSSTVMLRLNLARGYELLSLALWLILLGITWVLVGYALLRVGARRPQQPTRVR